MDDGAWNDGELRVLGIYLSKSLDPADPEKTDDLYLVFNAGGDFEVRLPDVNGLEKWTRVLDTGVDDEAFAATGQENPVTIHAQSVVAFVPEGQAEPA
jgi:glycogen operon protein